MCNLSSLAHDTQIFYAHSECTEVERAINSDLAYDLNGLKRNNSKYQAIVMGKTQNKPTFRCENTIIPITFFFSFGDANWRQHRRPVKV